MSTNREIEIAALNKLGEAQTGGTAYWVSNSTGYSRKLVSAALQRMKRRGAVTNEGSAWKAVSQ